MAKPSRTTLRSLTPDPRNANKGSERGTGMLEHSLRQYGAGRSLLVDKHGVVIAGNKTLEAAASLGMDEIQIVQSDGTKLVVVQRTDLDLAKDAKAKELAVADNRVAQVSLDWDAEVLRQLADEGADLSALFTKDELADLVDVEPVAGRTDPDDVPEPRATDIKPGDLFQLGKHRLLCGDSTKAEDVARVMDGEKADLLVTSPPYNQSIERFRPSGMHKGGGWVEKVERLAYSDSMPEEDYQQWQVLSLHAWAEFLRDGASVFYNHKNRYRDKQIVSPLTWLANGPFKIRQEIVWSRPGSVTQNARMFLPSDERIYWLYKGDDFYFDDSTDIKSWSSVWEIALETNKTHAVGFPVELPSRAIRACSHQGDVILEPYSGSGTTIIACEQLGRACCALEVDPHNVQIAIDRWEAFTGQKAQKVGEVALAS